MRKIRINQKMETIVLLHTSRRFEKNSAWNEILNSFENYSETKILVGEKIQIRTHFGSTHLLNNNFQYGIKYGILSGNKDAMYRR